MKSIPVLILAACAALTLALNDAAEARRMGGGGSYGTQRSVTPQRATPAPTSPTNNAATPPSQPAQPGAPASANQPKAAPAPGAQPAPSGISRWLGPIAGIAAGLGLAALMSHFGLSEGFGSLLLLALLVFGAIFLVRTFLARRAPANPPLQYAGARRGDAAPPSPYASEPAATDSRPAWRIPSQSELDGTGGTQAAPVFGVARNPLPAGFDAAGFTSEAKRQYIELQRAYDKGDRTALANFMTAEMAAEIGRDLDTRGIHHPTEIVTLDAEVLDVSTEGDQHWVSVRFTGLVKEDGDPVPHSVDEVWNLSKPVKGGSGWLLAGISQLA